MIYLASRSARRREILRKMKLRFRCVPSRYREKVLPGHGPRELVLKHAFGKALRARLPAKARYVLAADTLVWRKKVYGKPRTMREATRMLTTLSGKAHEVYTGVVLRDLKTGRSFSGTARTRVYFKRLSRDTIRDYFRQVNPLDKAGAYAIQEGPKIVRKIEGSCTNVVGLPVELLRRLLKKCSGQPILKRAKPRRK
ncbi:MAG TPA: nucleoside triphosphate pyrophosphatase [Candidatus Omnitrophota bacterium]|jgi:septum formation protein|nr:nucleoside triphosphate pyrophosphatase [Candidatus Omnitrophota bacterium]HPW65001.1 nucleoside triphosphate pyrophosphatase [Candidatus Omnitrophota bacterium]